VKIVFSWNLTLDSRMGRRSSAFYVAGGVILQRNFGNFLLHYTAPHTRRQNLLINES
jgi:hypothetical protein